MGIFWGGGILYSVFWGEPDRIGEWEFWDLAGWPLGREAGGRLAGKQGEGRLADWHWEAEAEAEVWQSERLQWSPSA